ncbi:UDP-glycosyltransferase [Ramlibacter algicola]|uniref:UDP-glycosyltransferase n=1 Tax=Ramlibacter algicola TaxID=2795217 RepID=A0A934Q4Z6_9BURK|nr:UDP-glycosyltransferase [Ramlibacter algicola]MBK0394302.1 UDP-glycosyltransferase [Ramlibacter algicola]
MKKVLFVCYGSGHVRMVVPVARALQDSSRAQVQVLGLTTAAQVVRDAGLPLLQVKDFVRPGDDAALAAGDALMRSMANVVDPDETRAYLGLSYAQLEREQGTEQARRRHEADGRQAFLPTGLLERILDEVRPDLVVATNSPRAERAAILAARAREVPAVCIVDLFAIDEVRWIGQPGYADRICVLNEHVRDFLVAAGRSPHEIAVTGNPAFDVLLDPAVQQAGHELRQARGWGASKVVLWPAQDEPARHPFDGRPGDPQLPARALAELVAWCQAADDRVLCVRARAGQGGLHLPDHPRIVATGQDWPLPPLLHAVDAVVTLTSTVGLEGRLAGARLVQVTGSVFDDAMPLARFGLADAAVPLQQLPAALDAALARPRHPVQQAGAAAPRVLAQLAAFL